MIDWVLGRFLDYPAISEVVLFLRRTAHCQPIIALAVGKSPQNGDYACDQTGHKNDGYPRGGD
ncbi:hypothetical protein THTE_0731 [Thermogutta terrifontis]|uniref:Uncharacterized protein n=1 Tax=Thermogutta terrifontis TaxID=1331910 RepID=A0A286RBJ5_9BACT|nr:hypothetical protein THTE_0731 [Thermogutta terrifontis]